jgi:hypothetical protein
MLNGEGGFTNGPYYVPASTNLALPLNQWTRSPANQFDANGNFLFASPRATNALKSFYSLQLPAAR